jgi:Predicted ATPase
MSQVFPGLEAISTSINSSGGLEIQLVEEGVGRPWAAHEISDGTIQYLALLAVLYDGTSPALMVEEPENSLHSWMLRSFIDMCRERPERQVLITTHSPLVLKSVTPDQVILAWKRDGRTKLARLLDIDPDAERMYSEEGLDVFEQYDSGFLPQSLPQGRQS